METDHITGCDNEAFLEQEVAGRTRLDRGLYRLCAMSTTNNVRSIIAASPIEFSSRKTPHPRSTVPQQGLFSFQFDDFLVSWNLTLPEGSGFLAGMLLMEVVFLRLFVGEEKSFGRSVFRCFCGRESGAKRRASPDRAGRINSTCLPSILQRSAEQSDLCSMIKQTANYSELC